MKLYLVDYYETQMASEKGIRAVREITDNTTFIKSEVLEEADVELPKEFSVKPTQCADEIFKGDENAQIVTEIENGKYVTSLVTSEGIVKLHEWKY
jgi:hypothetical protein